MDQAQQGERGTPRKQEVINEQEAKAPKKKKPNEDSDEDEQPEVPNNSGPVLPVQLGDNDPPTDEETVDSDDTQFYPCENSGDALLVVDEAVWQGLSESHRVASNTASFSFVTSMEGDIQDIS